RLLLLLLSSFPLTSPPPTSIYTLSLHDALPIFPTVAPPYDHHRMAHYSEGMSSDFVKQRQAAPEGFFAAEAAGLQWLADPDAVPVVEVVDHGEDFLRLRRLDETGPDAAAAVDFGRRLARLLDAGASGFGWSPAAPAFFGPLDAPFEVSTESETSFSEFWTAGRLSPLLSAVEGDLSI